MKLEEVIISQAAEIAELRAEVKDLRESRDRWYDMFTSKETECAKLRCELNVPGEETLTGVMGEHKE